MTEVFVDGPPAELEMEQELQAIKDRYQTMFDESEIDMGQGVGAKTIKGQTNEAWVNLFNLRDGTVSTVTTDAASRIIKGRGRGVFALRPPSQFQYARDSVTGRPVKVNPTALRCRLHPEAEDRAWLDEIGLAGQECPKSNIPSRFLLERHMRVKHKDEWAAIQKVEADQKEAESRELARMQAEAMRAMAADNRRMTKGA